MRPALCYPSSLPPTFACVAIASYWFHHHLQLPCDCAASWGGRIGGRQQLAHQGAKAETASTHPRGRGPDRRRAHQRQAVEEGEQEEEEEGASVFSLGAKVRNRKESLGLKKFASPASNLGIRAKWVSNDVRLLYWMSNFEIFHVAVVLLINGHYIYMHYCMGMRMDRGVRRNQSLGMANPAGHPRAAALHCRPLPGRGAAPSGWPD